MSIGRKSRISGVETLFLPLCVFQDFIETLPKLSGYHGQDLFGIWSKVYDPLFCEVKEKNIKE